MSTSTVASPTIRTHIHGTPLSTGRRTGRARIASLPGDWARLRAGEILVCTHLSSDMAPLLRKAAGIISEAGGPLSNMATIVRELKVPAVSNIDLRPGEFARARSSRSTARPASFRCVDPAVFASPHVAVASDSYKRVGGNLRLDRRSPTRVDRCKAGALIQDRAAPH